MALTETGVWRRDLRVQDDTPDIWDLYVRQSADCPDGIDRQIEILTEEVHRRGCRVGRIYADNEGSANTKKKRRKTYRPDYLRLMRDIDSGTSKAFACVDQDRLLRDVREGEDLIDAVEKTNCGVLFSRSGEPDLQTADGRMHVRMKAVIARQELEKKAERAREANSWRASHGGFYAPKRAFGYNADGTVNVAEAEVVRDAFERLFRGESLRGITRAVNAAGLVTVRGGQWQPSGVRYMLLNPRYAGWRIYHPGQPDEIRRRGSWDAIITEEDHERATALFTDPERRTTGTYPGGTARKWLGSGLYYCGGCEAEDGHLGSRVQIDGRGRGAETRAYVCRRSYHVSRGREAVDQIVLDHVELKLKQSKESGEAADLLVHGTPELLPLRAEAKELEKRLALALDRLDRGVLDEDDYSRTKRQIKAELAVINRKISQAARGSVLSRIAAASDPWVAFCKSDLAIQRDVVDALFDVVLHPSTRPFNGRGSYFDVETVEIRWRDRPREE